MGQRRNFHISAPPVAIAAEMSSWPSWGNNGANVTARDISRIYNDNRASWEKSATGRPSDRPIKVPDRERERERRYARRDVRVTPDRFLRGYFPRARLRALSATRRFVSQLTISRPPSSSRSRPLRKLGKFINLYVFVFRRRVFTARSPVIASGRIV